MGRKTIGEIFDVKAEEARVLIDNQQAEEVTTSAKPSGASKPASGEPEA
jgi:hypothetical protein